MTAKLVIAGVVVGLVGASQCAWSQGRDYIQPFNQQRKVNIITPGSLYKNPALKQDPAASLIKPAQTAKSAATSQPQKTASTPQLQTKAPSLDAAQAASPFAPKPQPSPFSTPPQPTPFVSVFTPGQSGQQTPPQQQAPQVVPAVGQPPVISQTTPLFPAMSVTTPAATPPPPTFAITPQFTAVSPLSPAGLPNASATAPAKQSLVAPNPPLVVPQVVRPGTPQIGGASPLQRPGLAMPQIAPVVPGSATPLLPSAPSALTTPLGTQVQQPFYVPQTPFVAPATSQR
jgi:hypothetical protein